MLASIRRAAPALCCESKCAVWHTNDFAASFSVAAAQVCICDTLARHQTRRFAFISLAKCKSVLGKPEPERPEASSKLSNGKPPVSTGLEEASMTCCGRLSSAASADQPPPHTLPFVRSYTRTPAKVSALSGLSVLRGVFAGPQARNSGLLVHSASCTLLGLGSYARNCQWLALRTRDS